MKKNEHPFQQPRRQSQAAIVIFIYNFLMRILRGAWPILLVLLFRSGREQSRWEVFTNLALLFGGLGSLIVSIVAYYRYYYHVEGGQLLIRRGVFNQSRVRLPFERIQNLHIEQNILHRMLGVVSLRIESAGSSGSEVTIDALKRERAELLREYIFEQKAGQDVDSGPEEKAATQAASPQSLVLRLSIGDLLKVGVTQNHLATAGLILGGVFGFIFTIAGTLDRKALESIYKELPGFELGFRVYVYLALFLILLSFFVTLFRTLSRYYGLEFWERRDGFSLKAGLLNRREASMQKRKIQLIRWADNPLRRLLGLFRLSVHQAVSGGGVENIGIPGCQQAQVDDVVHSSFRGVESAEWEAHGISPHYYWWYWRFYGVLPALLFAGLWWWTEQARFALPLIGFPLLAFLFFWRYQRNFRLFVDSGYLKTVRGVLGRSYTLLPMYKVQSVQLRQSFYQRRQGLATVVVFTAGGDVTVPFLPLPLARAVQDYLLYRVESSGEEWM